MTDLNKDPNAPMNFPRITLPEEDSRKLRNAKYIAIADLLIMAVLSLFFFTAATNRHLWQFFLFGGVTVAGLVTSAVSTFLAFKRKTFPSILITVITWCILWITLAAFTTGVGLVVAATIIIISILVAAETLNNRQTSIIIAIGVISAALALAANSYLLFPRLNLPFSSVLFPSVLAALVIIYVILMIRRFQAYSLQVKLIAVFFAIALLPLGVIAALYNNTLTNIVTQKTQDALMIGASQTAASVDKFITSNLSDIRTAAQDPTFVKYISLSGDYTTPDPLYEKDVRLLLNNLKEKDFINITSYALLNVQGHVVYNTNPDRFSQDESQADYFKTPMQTGQPYMSTVLFSPMTGQPSIYFSAPIRLDSGKSVAVIRVRYDAAILQQIINQYNGFLGPHSYPILLDENMVRLADSLTPENIYKSIIPLNVQKIRQLQNEYRLLIKPDNLLSTNIPALADAFARRTQQPFFTAEVLPGLNRTEAGAVAQLQTRSWTIVYMQDQAIIMTPITNQTRLLVLLATLVAGLVTVIAIGLAFLLSRPIRDLTEVSIKVSMGDLSPRAKVRSSDEIGVLGQAFNRMTTQLQSLIGGLERRVAERTHDLALESERNRYRAAQLQTVADVARAITTVQDLESVLTSVTRLINERFGFYHVGIFLLDEKKEFALLRAANSEGGQRMLARGHRLKVGQVGIVGYVTGNGEPRIATDVGADAVFFNNPDLPDTRSEMALPLKAAGQVIGALDVQSKESNAFAEEDIELFLTLSDQIAIAIENNRLFAETRESLIEAQILHRQYLRQEWGREIAERKVHAVRYTRRGIFTQDPVDLPEIQKAFLSGEIVTLPVNRQADSSSKSSMAVPIKIRDEVIGVINFQDTNENRTWSDEEINLAKKVADQVAVALENVRLFEQTVRRAEREQKVLEITGKIRSTNDPQAMLQMAVSELQKALNTSRAQIILPAGSQFASEAASLGTLTKGSNGQHPAKEK